MGVEIKFSSWRNEYNKNGDKEFLEISVDDCLDDEDKVVMKEISFRGYSIWSKSEFMVSLDVETAVKFSKELRKQINKAKEGGQSGK